MKKSLFIIGIAIASLLAVGCGDDGPRAELDDHGVVEADDETPKKGGRHA